MSQLHFLLIIICLVVASVGCRNRSCNPYGACYADGSSIAPPPTGSLTIPSIARNQPYTAPGNPGQPSVNPNSRVPVPGGAPGPQPSWGPTNGQSNLPGGPTTGPTTFVETRSGAPASAFPGGQPGVRTASLPGTGTPFTASTNYQTTQVDERNDSTRLPLSDASSVRAPSAYGIGSRLPPSQNPANYPPNRPVQQTYVAQQGNYPTGPAPFGSRGVLVGQPATQSPNVYRGQAVMVAPSQPAVLAQSTAVASPNSSQLGWRDRELNSGN